MNPKLSVIPILLFLLISIPTFGQVNVKIDCPNAIAKDCTTFVFKEWIKREIPKDSLMFLSEEAYVEIWGIPENELRDDWTDTLLIKLLEEGKTLFLSRMNRLHTGLKSDEKIYLYSSSKSDWETLAGEVGFVVLRGCELIDIYVIARS